MTTYQRLKKENEQMRRELDIVCNEPNSREGFSIKSKYRFKRKIEEQFWNGDTTKQEYRMQGIITQISLT